MASEPQQNGQASPEARTQSVPIEVGPPTRVIRVAWIASPGTLDQYGRVLQPLAIGLLDELVELTALCPQRADVQQLPSPPMRIVPYGCVNWWAFWETSPMLEQLAEEIRQHRIELLHALDAGAASLTARLARMTGIRYFLSSYSLRDGKALGRLDSLAAGVLAASGPILRELRRRRVVPAQRIHLLRPGVYQVKHATCFVGAQYSVTIVAGGALDAAAFQAVLRSFAEVAAKQYDCAYFIMGGGRAEKQLRLLSERLALRNELTFVEHQPNEQLAEIFKAADLYISPVPGRDLDVHCLLAMAAGVPVLAAGEGASDFLRNGQTCLLFQKGSASELTSKLINLLEDRASARALAENALSHLRESHSPAGMVMGLSRIYRAALAESAELAKAASSAS